MIIIAKKRNIGRLARIVSLELQEEEHYRKRGKYRMTELDFAKGANFMETCMESTGWPETLS